MSDEELMELAERGRDDPASLTADEIRELALAVMFPFEPDSDSSQN